MTSQLLIEMPAEGAARLITLSLLEEVSQYASATAADPRNSSRYAVAYRAAVRRLRACVALYADVLDDSVSRKTRRRLRALGNAAERLHRADVQVAWCARHIAVPEQLDPTGGFTHTRAAAWLSERVGRRRDRALRLLLRAQKDSRPLRRIAKRLGVYTTAVRLDSVPSSQSFAHMTSEQLIVNADALGSAMRTAQSAGSHAELRRAHQAAERLAYLLEPLRAYADIEEPSARIAALRAALGELEKAMMVGRAIVRGGRRVAAMDAQDRLGSAIWGSHAGLPTETSNGRPQVSGEDLQRGLLMLAQELHDEATRSFAALGVAWEESGGDAFVERITGLAGILQA